MLKNLPPFTKNFYFVAGMTFLSWMLFIDTNDLYSQYKLKSKLSDLAKEKAYYETKIEEVRADRQQLLTNQDLLEKFAREKYLMKKETEDLFVIVEED